MSRNTEIAHNKEYTLYRIRKINNVKTALEEEGKTDFKNLPVRLFRWLPRCHSGKDSAVNAGDARDMGFMSDSVQPLRWQPTRLPRPWDSPGKNTGVDCHFLPCAWRGGARPGSRVTGGD